MRINLVTPFAERDAAKALGARWDSTLKTWYIQNVADLTPFQRWIPATANGSVVSAARPGRPSHRSAMAPPSGGGAAVTQSVAERAHCGCDVLPWEPCSHHA